MTDNVRTYTLHVHFVSEYIAYKIYEIYNNLILLKKQTYSNRKHLTYHNLTPLLHLNFPRNDLSTDMPTDIFNFVIYEEIHHHMIHYHST